jgi:polyisoprenoid-binding protein YceI
VDSPKTGRWKRWLLIAVISAVGLAVVGPYVYIHFIEGKPPAPLALTTSAPAATTDPSSSTPSGSFDAYGTWSVAEGSQVGYRVKEVIFGQSNEAVGRTSDVAGTISVAGSTIRSATFTADMTSVASDQSRRDTQFHGRIMNTSTFPTATFTLTQPIDVGSIPTDGVAKTYEATGEFTIHGVTKRVAFPLTGKRSGSTIQVSGSIPIVFADWGIGNPSFGPVTTEDHGVMEFLLNFRHA